jgi:hypothetical protein
VAADFNGDGKLDLAMAGTVASIIEPNADTLSVLLGNGDGSFGNALRFDAGLGPRSVAAGDFNGDGVPDLAVGITGKESPTGSGTVSVLLNQTPVLVASGVNISATAGAPFSGTVATFVNADPSGTAASYTALIDWGDDSTSTGVISSTFTVTGTHTYADPINRTLHVTISHNLGYTTTATTTSTATVTSLGLGVQKGQTGGIGFWHNKNGQALLKSFGPTASGLTLANWLAMTFPRLYGASAGTNNDLTNKSNGDVAAYFLTLFKLSATQVEAQVLAVALNVYATTASLGGTAGVAYGFTVSAAGLGARTYNVGNNDGAAFGVANGTTLNVYELLMAVNNKAVNGVLDNGDPTSQAETANLFNSLNTAGSLN